MAVEWGWGLVLLAFLLSLALDGVDADLFVVLLQGGKVLTGLGELTLLHTLSYVPVDEGSLGVHQIELVVKTSPGLSDGGGVAQHADGSLYLGEITSWHDSWWLVVDSDLESGWAPVDELNGSLGLDGGNGSVDILGDDISSVQHAASHVLAMTWVALHHLVGWLKAGVGDLGNRQLLMVSLLSGDDWGISGQRKMDSWVWHQVGLELGKIDVEGTIKSQGGGDGRNDLSNQPVEVGVGWSLNVEVTSADVIESLVVNHEGTVRVLKSSVSGQDGVVGLNNSGGDLGGWVDGKLQFRLLAVVDGQTLHEKGGESGSGATTEGVEDQESLKSSTLVSQLPETIEHQVNNFFPNCVVTTGVVVGSILLASDELLGVEQLAIGTSSNLI